MWTVCGPPTGWGLHRFVVKISARIAFKGTHRMLPLSTHLFSQVWLLSGKTWLGADSWLSSQRRSIWSWPASPSGQSSESSLTSSTGAGPTSASTTTCRRVSGTSVVPWTKYIYKTPNPKCRLYWCLIVWRYSQSWYYFRPALWSIAPLTFFLISSPPSPLACVDEYTVLYTRIQCVRGGVWGHRRGVGLRKIRKHPCRQVPLLVNF